MKELINYLLVPVLALFTTAGAVQAAVETDEEEQQTEKHVLVVKVAGYNAQFIMLDKRLQDQIIARTEYLPITSFHG